MGEISSGGDMGGFNGGMNGCDCGGCTTPSVTYNTTYNTIGVGNPIPPSMHGFGSGDLFGRPWFPIAIQGSKTTNTKRKKSTKRKTTKKKKRNKKIHEDFYMKKEQMILENLSDSLYDIISNALDEYADGTEDRVGYYMCSVGDTDDEDDAVNLAYRLYDKYTHNEMEPDEVIDAIEEYFGTLDMSNADESEVIGRDMRLLGYSKDGKYGLFYDPYVGSLNVFDMEI